MIGKGREQRGERGEERLLYIVNCIIVLLSLLLLLLCHYLLRSQHSHRLFFRSLPSLSSPLLFQASTALLYS